VNRSTLINKMKRLGISRPAPDGEPLLPPSAQRARPPQLR